MPRTWRLFGWSLAVVTLGPTLSAQQPVEDRPEVLKTGALTREQLERRQAEQLVREAQAVFGLGVLRQREARWLEAVKLLEESARLDPESPAAYRALVPLYMSLAREEDALDACRKVLERDPADAETAFQLAKLLKADGRAREAIVVLAKGTTSKRVEDRPGLLYHMLDELAGLQEKAGDLPAAADSYQRLAKHLGDQRARLVGSETLTPEQLALATARAHERVGHCRLGEKKYAEAVAAFERARDLLEKQPDADTRAKAVRLTWNLAQVCLTREQWADALAYLDAYLEHKPEDAEPYEKKALALRKLGRERDVLPALKKHAGRSKDVLAVQLAYAKELARDPRARREAEQLYLDLAGRFVSPDVYRGLFKLYHADDRMVEVLNLVDRVYATLTDKDEVPADVREGARERGRAMLQVLKGEPALVGALLPVALQELRGDRDRKVDTWLLLASLAARARQLDKAEVLFRQCLARAPAHQEAGVYGGLLEVLWARKKHDAVITLCRDALDGPRKAAATNAIVFHRYLALAYAEKEKTDDALAEIDKAIKLATEAGKVYERCRKARVLALAGRYDAAVAECESLLKELAQAGEIRQVRYTLASVYTFKGEHEKSEAQLLKILEDDPNDPGANNDLGYHWADRNRNLDEAEKMIRKAIEVDRARRKDDPDDETENASFLDSLGWVLYRQGKAEEAREWLEKAAAMPSGSESGEVWDHLGDVYHKLEQPAKARQAWQNAAKHYEADRRAKKEGRLDEARRKIKTVSE